VWALAGQGDFAPDGAWEFIVGGFYKYSAPTALPEPEPKGKPARGVAGRFSPFGVAGRSDVHPQRRSAVGAKYL